MFATQVSGFVRGSVADLACDEEYEVTKLNSRDSSADHVTSYIDQLLEMDKTQDSPAVPTALWVSDPAGDSLQPISCYLCWCDHAKEGRHPS